MAVNRRSSTTSGEDGHTTGELGLDGVATRAARESEPSSGHAASSSRVCRGASTTGDIVPEACSSTSASPNRRSAPFGARQTFLRSWSVHGSKRGSRATWPASARRKYARPSRAAVRVTTSAPSATLETKNTLPLMRDGSHHSTTPFGRPDAIDLAVASPLRSPCNPNGVADGDAAAAAELKNSTRSYTNALAPDSRKRAA
eukprot:scaffold149714_cov37-Tisochrysis_lutea.AAC.5